MSKTVYDALKPDVGPKVGDFVDAALNIVDIELNHQIDLLHGDISRLEVQIRMMKEDITELKNKEPNPEDDKYSFTKKKLVRFMKAQGWYD